MKPYCTQNGVDCTTCSLSRYGKDCQNNLINDKKPDELSLTQAAKMLGLKDGGALRQAIRRKQINPEHLRMIGRTYLITMDGVEKYREEHLNKQGIVQKISMEDKKNDE